MQSQYATPVTKFSSANERELYYCALAGDPRSREILGKRYLRRVSHVCRRVLGEVVDAQDATQDAMFNVFNNLDKFEGRSSLRSWIYSIGLNKALDYRSNREKYENRYTNLTDEALIVDAVDGPYDRNELIQKVLEAGKLLLNDKQRITFFLVDVDGRQLKNVAEENGWNQETAKSIHLRSKQNIEKILKNHFGITRDDFYAY